MAELISKRKLYGVRPPKAIAAALEEVTVHGRKETYNSYILRVLAEHFDLPAYEIENITPVCEHQQELPMTAA